MKKGATDKRVKRAENHNGEKRKSREDCIKGKRRNMQKRNESNQE